MAVTPHMALRVIEQEFRMNEGFEDELRREEALAVLWKFVLLGESDDS